MKIIIIVFTWIVISSCGVSKPHHACGITELNKQYSGARR
jgi:hypothetical protein